MCNIELELRIEERPTLVYQRKQQQIKIRRVFHKMNYKRSINFNLKILYVNLSRPSPSAQSSASTLIALGICLNEPINQLLS